MTRSCVNFGFFFHSDFREYENTDNKKQLQSTDMLSSCCCCAVEQRPANEDCEISFYDPGGQHQLEKQAEHEKFVLGPTAEGAPV